MRFIKGQLCMSLVIMLVVSLTMAAIVSMIKVTWAPAQTYFWVNPPQVRDKTPTQTFAVYINISEAPSTYAWEILLKWNTTLLEWFYKQESSFLSRGMYETVFTTSTYSEANLNGEMVVSCTLKGEVPWASGNGSLCRLGFRVRTGGYGSSVLDLHDTRLYDYEYLGSPAYTYYPNQDGFFYNQPYHDIALTNVVTQPATVYSGNSATINATIKNEGNFTETSGTFNVTVYADKNPYEYLYDPVGRLIGTNVAVGDEIIVGTKSVTSPLAIGASTTLTFTWNTAGAEQNATYTISAVVMGDNDNRDNLYIDATVYVKMRGDVNSDGRVNVPDLFALGKAYGSTAGPPASPNWNPACDFNGDRKVDVSDLSDLKANYGKIAGT